MMKHFKPHALALTCLLSLVGACKTPHASGSSGTKDWLLDGNKQATDAFIINTVKKYCPQAAPADPSSAALQKFAAALESQTTNQAESPDYVLQQYYLESQQAPEDGMVTPLEAYILTEFMVLTNFEQVRTNAAPTLVYTGGNAR